jgi:hypothetical protein
MTRLFTKWGAVFLTAAALIAIPTALWAACPDRPPCEKCGCKGGSGYRAPDGHCVGFRELTKICGAYPHTLCTFENAPGTGANKNCALAPKKHAQKSAPEAARQTPAEPEISEEEEEDDEM